jgi:site-specific DNA-cytosine methylase
MNVLSLFDGMSCGQIALDQLGIKVDNYFASEIDKHAIKVAQSNYPDTIQLGDVVSVKGLDLPKIDLLYGGSPCQGFSFAGKKLNFKDPRSKLFFEFVRLLEETKPKYFLLENVRMKQESQDVISKYLGVKPVLINSRLVSAQNRARYYWTNIPLTQPTDLNITLSDVVGQDCIGASKRGRYISGNSGKTQQKVELRSDYKSNAMTTVAKNCMLKVVSTGELRNIYRNEAEMLQNVPTNYTRDVSVSQALKMLGNGWTVDVIKHIFKNLK